MAGFLVSWRQGVGKALRILYLGEIVGKSGVFCVKQLLPALKKERAVDFVIANGEGATGGFGIGKNHSIYLHKLGVDVITSGECIYYKKDMVEHLPKAPYILRPANYPYGNPGRGWMVYPQGDRKIAVFCLLGQAAFQRVHAQNPFLLAPELIERLAKETSTIIVDFHAATTAEKYTMFYQLDGKVSAVIGSHTKALTADERVLPGGTAVIGSAGRTGSLLSVGGLDPQIEIRKFLTQVHEHSREAWSGLELQGVLMEIGDDGRAVAIERLRLPCQAPAGEEERRDD